MATESSGEYPLADEPQYTRYAGNNSNPAPQAIPVYMPTQQQPPKKRWSLIRFLFRTAITLIFLISIGANIYFASLFTDGIYADTYHMGADMKHQLALIELNDTIDMNTAEYFRKALQKAHDDESIKGIILVINSPGGEVTPSDMITENILRVKEHANKPVYAVIEQVGASGAYWVASAADTIYGQQHSVIGSIGVIYVNMVLEEALRNKLGVDPVVIKSSRSPHKDQGSPFRKPSEEEILDIQADLDTIHRDFVETVMQNRNLTSDQVWELANGDVFDGPESLAHHLIDKLGVLQDAISEMSDDLGLADPTIIIYRQHTSFQEMLAARRQTELFNLQHQFDALIRKPRIQAIWLGH